MNALIETLNYWGEAAIPLAGQVLWQTSLLIIVLLALDLWLRHRIRAGFRYALWMLLLVKLVLPPSLALPTGAGYWIERPAKVEAPVEPPVAEVAVLPPSATEFNHATDPGIVVEADFFDHLLTEAMADASTAATALEFPVEPEPAATLNVRGQLLAAWFAGTLLLLGWMLWRWRWVNRLVRASEPGPADLQALLANVYRHKVGRAACPTPSVLPAACRQFPEADRTAAGHERKGDTPVAQSRVEATRVSPFRFFGTPPACPTLRLTDAAMSPAVCGLFRPVILLPRKLVGKLSREQLGTVLLHELIHLRRRDLWVNCVQTLLQIAAWWHPLLWLANARIRRVREEAVDEAVTCALRDDADAYPATLLEVAKLTFTRPLMTLGLVGILESKHALKQRIRRLLELPPLESTRLKWWQWIAVAAIALTALPMAEGQRLADVVSSDPSTVNSGDQVQEQVAAADESAGKNEEEHGAVVEQAYDVLLERLNRLGSDIPALTNALHEAQVELEKYQAERSAVLLRMLVSDVWLLDKTILEHPFVKRHLEVLKLAPPPEWVAIDERYQTARIVRDMISMKLAQEKINEALGQNPAPVDHTKVRAEFQRQLDSAERGMQHAREEYRALREKLGPDPLTRPEQTLSKEEFLRLMPVIQAGIRLSQSSNQVHSARQILAQVEARANDQGSLSPQSGMEKRTYGWLAEQAPEWQQSWGMRQPSPPFKLPHTNLTEYGAQMITSETLFPDPRVSGYRIVGLEPRFVLVPVEGLSRALGGQLPLARPLIIASNELAALTNSLIEAGAVNHAFTELPRFSKMSGGVFHWQVAKEEPSLVMFQPADNPSTNAAAGPRQIVFGARHGVPAFAPDWVPLTLLARPFAGDDESLHSILSLATGEQQPVALAQAEETIPLGASLIWASTNEVRAGFAQAVILHNSGPPAEEADESADGAGEAAAKIQNARELIEAGKLDEAEALLREAAKADPGNSMVSYYFAQISRSRQPVEFERAGLREPLTEGQRKLMEKLNRITLDQVEFDNAPLVEVVKELQEESRRSDPEKEGVRFMIAGSIDVTDYEDDPADSTGRPPPIRPTTRLEIGDPKITINPPLSNARMIDVLNAVVRSAGAHVEFVVEEFAVVFRPKLPAQSALQTRVFRLNPNTFDRMKAAHTNAPIPSGVMTNGMSVASIAASDYFKTLGVTFELPKRIYFNERTGLLMIKATLEDLEIIQRAVEKLVEEGEPQASPPAESGSGAGATDGKPGESASNEENAERQRTEYLETRVFRVNPNTFYAGLEAISTQAASTAAPRTNAPVPVPRVQGRRGGGVRFLTVTNDMSVVNLAVREFFEMAGVQFEPPKMIYFNDRTGMLMVKATLEDLEVVQRAVEMLNYEPPQITLEVRTVEVTKDDVRALGFDWFVANTIEPITGPIPAHPSTVAGILTDPQFRIVLKALEQRANVDVEFFPRTTTLSSGPLKLKSTIVLSNMVVAVSNTPAGQSHITEDVEVGTKLDVVPQVGADGYTIRLGVVFERTDFLGYSDPVEAGKPAGTPLPRFKLFSMATTANLWDGQTLVLTGIPPEPSLQTPDAERRHVLLFITPTIIDPAGNRVHSPEQLPFTREQVPRQPGQE